VASPGKRATDWPEYARSSPRYSPIGGLPVPSPIGSWEPYDGRAAGLQALLTVVALVAAASRGDVGGENSAQGQQTQAPDRLARSPHAHNSRASASTVTDATLCNRHETAIHP
jgi:hypothetical protein